MTTILYHPVHQTAEANQKASIKGEDQSDLLHPLTLPGYYIEPVPYIEYAKEEHKDYKYYNDPSWRHYAKPAVAQKFGRVAWKHNNLSSTRGVHLREIPHPVDRDLRYY